MTDYTPPNVRRIITRGGTQRTVALGYVDRHGVYRLPNGITVTAAGAAFTHDGTKVGNNILIRDDGAVCPNDQHAAAWPEGAKHCVDRDYQNLYDADPDTFDTDPMAVFTAAGN